MNEGRALLKIATTLLVPSRRSNSNRSWHFGLSRLQVIGEVLVCPHHGHDLRGSLALLIHPMLHVYVPALDLQNVRWIVASVLGLLRAI